MFSILYRFDGGAIVAGANVMEPFGQGEDEIYLHMNTIKNTRVSAYTHALRRARTHKHT